MTVISCAIAGTAFGASDYPIQPIPFTNVRFTRGVFEARQATNRTVTIPFGLEQCETSGRLKNFDLAAQTMQKRLAGDAKSQNTPATIFPFDDTDIYKALEGAAYSLQTTPDPQLAQKVQTMIPRVKAAQEPDGYLYTFRTMHPDSPAHAWIARQRWMLDPVLSHELYNLGHFYECATAYYQATGDKTLLDMAIKSAELVNTDLGSGTPRIAPGHQVIEMGLVRLYRQTGDSRWLMLAKQLLDNRGLHKEYSQDHKPVLEQDEAVGHAVRANYMYAGMADIAAIMGNAHYKDAVEKIWKNVVARKLHLTGGCGARAAGEAYGDTYELPNRCYNETCAALAFLFWTERMFLLTGNGNYMDVFERTLYNGTLSGVALSGDRFFYPNPLEYDGKTKNNHGHAGRAPWFGCACCPPNVMRVIASLGNYAYAMKDDTLYVNLYNTGTLKWKGLALTQQTDYPWDGTIKFTITPEKPMTLALALRIPGWTRGQPLPSDLYAYENATPAAWSVKVNGKQQPIETLDEGYAVLRREWHAGDTVELNLPMEIRRVRANSNVTTLKNHIAFERGPIVFAFEAIDQKSSLPWRQWAIPSDVPLQAVFRPHLLGGVITLEARTGGDQWLGIPYAWWANRDLSPMRVWLSDGTKRETSNPRNVALNANIEVSFARDSMDPNVLNDDSYPQNATDMKFKNFDFWPHRGGNEWILYTFIAPVAIHHCEMQWFDDTKRGGGCSLPATYSVEYFTEGTWKPVEVEQKTDQTLTFKKVTTDKLRLNIQQREGRSSGLYEWIVE